MHWIHLSEESQITDVISLSYDRPVVVFKHSNRCVISTIVLNRIEKLKMNFDVDFYFIDVIAHRNISQQIAETLKVHHESPQLLLIKSGDCVYTESHTGITAQELEEQVEQLFQVV